MKKKITNKELIKVIGKKKMSIIELAIKTNNVVEPRPTEDLKRAVWKAVDEGVLVFDIDYNISVTKRKKKK